MNAQGWETKKLGELLDVQNGFAFSSEFFDKSTGMPLVRIRDLRKGMSTEIKYSGDFDERFVIRAGDLLIGMDGEFRCYEWAGSDALLNQRVCRLVGFSQDIDPQFIRYGIDSHLKKIEDETPFVTVKHLSAKKIKEINFSYPPLTHQRRIVARIKELMGRLQEVEEIESTLEDDYRSLRYSSVSKVVTVIKEEHPIVTIGDIVSGNKSTMRSGPFGSAMKHSEFVDDGLLVIGIANVQENHFDPVRKWMITNQKFEEMRRYEVLPGDVLITIMGTIGRTCVVPEDVGKAITSKHVYRIRFPKDQVVPEYISYIVNFDFDARRQLYGTATGGVMPGLNATKLKSLNVCLPPVEVQKRIVAELDEIHAAVRERDAIAIGKDLPSVRESILRKIFAGEL